MHGVVFGYSLRSNMADNCCFSSHFLSNEWDLAHISGGGGMVN